jgi:hypothetical protein
MGNFVPIKIQGCRSGGIEENNFNAVYGAWSWADNFIRVAKALELAERYQPEAHCLRFGGLAAQLPRHLELRNSGFTHT